MDVMKFLFIGNSSTSYEVLICSNLNIIILIIKINKLTRQQTFVQNPSNDVRDHWQYEYGLGASNELYTGAMSSDFVGMTFPMVAEICLIKLHILLIGVEVETNVDTSGILFNPSPNIFKFAENSRGIFIAQNPQAVKR